MKLYLARHGTALSAELDPQCPLSVQGITEVTSVAKFLKQMQLAIPNIFHSSKQRAQQTAAIYHHELGDGELKEITGLQPMDDVITMANQISHFEEDVMLVGHLPFMGLLVSQLICHNIATSTVEFTPATVVCLERHRLAEWTIQWVIRPDMLIP